MGAQWDAEKNEFVSKLKDIKTREEGNLIKIRIDVFLSSIEGTLADIEFDIQSIRHEVVSSDPKAVAKRFDKFYHFIEKLPRHYGCNNQGKFVLQIFAAMCGEENPIAASSKTSGKEDFEILGSDCLPDGLRGLDDSQRKALFNKKRTGLSNPVKEHLLSRKNMTTFIAYSEERVGVDAFSKLCMDLEIEVVEDESFRATVFSAIFEQFLEFAKNIDDGAANVLNKTVQIRLSHQ